MNEIPDKLTIRLGPLRDPLADWCDRHETTPSEVIRKAVAILLGEEEPEMRRGNPQWEKR
mgnify:CR=1 FL=1